MEYAEGGSLAQKIQNYLVQGKEFGTDDILRYMAMITLGVMAMHSKNILHRDIKT
jgi:serine/threonine protein kinase